MVKLSLKQGLAIAGLLEVVLLIVAAGGLVADAEVAERRLDRTAQVQARLLREQAEAINELILLRPVTEPGAAQSRREKVQRRLNQLQSQARTLGIDATIEVRLEGEAGLAVPPPRTARLGFSVYQTGMVGVVDVRPAEVPGLLAMMGESETAKRLLWVSLLIPLTFAALVAHQHLGNRRTDKRVPAGLNELVQGLIDASRASDEARLCKLLEENAALISEINQSAVGLESNTKHLRETRLGLTRTPGDARA